MVYFTHVSYPLSSSPTYYWYLGKMNDVSFSSDILVVFGPKMHGILQGQGIGILPEIVCHFQDSALYRRIPKHITLENLDLGV